MVIPPSQSRGRSRTQGAENHEPNKILQNCLERAATFLGALLIENRIDADLIADANALHDDLMAAVQHQTATPTCAKTWFVAGGRDERTCGEFAAPDQDCAECGTARCAEHSDISYEEIEGRILCEDCEAGHGATKPSTGRD